MTKLKDLKASLLKDPGVRKEYDALEEEFALIAAVAKARMRAGLTQAQLAKRMKTTQSTVARLESGRGKLLERHKESLILSDQLKMEFLKNRQKVIVDSLKQLSKPQKAAMPAILFDYQPAKMLLKHQAGAEKQFAKVRAKIEAILNSPSSADHVYLALMRIFDHSTPLNLARPNKRRYTIRNLARKRFTLGYPPRKANDYSLGDAINWEWIVECAENSDPNVHVMIVSRDGDYGTSFGEDAILNDWLRREFKERVSKKRKIELTKKLTVALRADPRSLDSAAKV